MQNEKPWQKERERESERLREREREREMVLICMVNSMVYRFYMGTNVEGSGDINWP